MNSSTNSIESPCIGLCKLNDDHICTGCYRSRADITVWSSATDTERASIVKVAKTRAQANAAATKDNKC